MTIPTVITSPTHHHFYKLSANRMGDDMNQKLNYSFTHPILNFSIFVLISNERDLLEKLAFAKTTCC